MENDWLSNNLSLCVDRSEHFCPAELDPSINESVLDKMCSSFRKGSSFSPTQKYEPTVLLFRRTRNAYPSRVISPQSFRQYIKTGTFRFGFVTIAVEPSLAPVEGGSTHS